MTFYQEASSWLSPTSINLSSAPKLGSKAPYTSELPLPATDGKPTVLTFLRHCGCPFAEATFLNLRATAAQHPNVKFIAVSHSDQSSTGKWLVAVGGPGDEPNPVRVVVDLDRQIYAKWGLGTSSFWHVLKPSSLMAAYNLGKQKGIWNRPTESGSRWQTSGSWAVDGEGVVRWGRIAQNADEVPDFDEAVKSVLGAGKESAKL